MNLKLGDVQTTALIPLVIRANETKRKNARILDNKAVEIIDALGIDTKDLDKFFSHEGVVARTIMFDNAVKKLIEQYPDAVCVNIGCGLDDRFSRVDNGKIEWYNIDLADAVAVREKVYSEREREYILAGDILDRNCYQGIPQSKMTIIIAEGLLMYFSRDEVKKILNNITHNFTNGYLLAELMHPKMMKEKVHDTVKHTNAKFGWGTVNGAELLPLDNRLKLVSENSFFDEMKKYTLIGKIGNALAKGLNNRLAIYKWEGQI